MISKSDQPLKFLGLLLLSVALTTSALLLTRAGAQEICGIIDGDVLGGGSPLIPCTPSEIMTRDNEEGIALGIALSDPDLSGMQQNAVKFNLGTFSGANAFGITVKRMVNDNLLGNGEALTLSGGVAYGLDRNTVGGRVSVQIGW